MHDWLGYGLLSIMFKNKFPDYSVVMLGKAKKIN